MGGGGEQSGGRRPGRGGWRAIWRPLLSVGGCSYPRGVCVGLRGGWEPVELKSCVHESCDAMRIARGGRKLKHDSRNGGPNRVDHDEHTCIFE